MPVHARSLRWLAARSGESSEPCFSLLACLAVRTLTGLKTGHYKKDLAAGSASLTNMGRREDRILVGVTAIFLK